MSQIDEKKAAEIRWLVQQRYRQDTIAEHFGTSVSTVSRIGKNRTWKHAGIQRPDWDGWEQWPRGYGTPPPDRVVDRRKLLD